MWQLTVLKEFMARGRELFHLADVIGLVEVDNVVVCGFDVGVWI
jgi:hypothetical protein